MKASISRVRLFKSCRRAYEFRYVEGLEPIETADALETGKSYHSKLEELYKTGMFDDSDLSKASAMAKAYEKYIYPYVKVKDVEQPFEFNLCPEHSLIGVVDGIAEDGSIVEHKTTSADLDGYEFDLEWDEQIPCYMLAHGVNRMIYTIVKKPTIRIKKNETQEEFYQRMIDWYATDTEQKIRHLPVTRTDEQLEEFRKNMLRMCDEMERAEASGLLYKNPAYCHHWNRLCEYAQICNSYDPNEVYVNYERSNRHGNHKTESEEY